MWAGGSLHTTLRSGGQGQCRRRPQNLREEFHNGWDWFYAHIYTYIYIYMHTPEKIMFQKFINMRLNQTFVQETDQQHRKDTSKHAVLHSYQSGQPVGSKRSLVGSIRCMAAVRAGRVDSNAGGSWAINQLEFSWVTFTGLKKNKVEQIAQQHIKNPATFFSQPSVYE